MRSGGIVLWMLALVVAGCSGGGGTEDVAKAPDGVGDTRGVDAPVDVPVDAPVDALSDSAPETIPDPIDVPPELDTCEPDCAPDPPAGIPWNDGPYGSGIMDTAGGFSTTTLDGDWALQAEWTGLDSYLFINRWGGSIGNVQTWDTSVADLLATLPDNVHLFFGSYDTNAAGYVDAMKKRVGQALDGLSHERQVHWAARVHFIDVPMDQTTGALGDFVGAHGAFYFAIDRFQRWREVGSLFDWQAYYTEAPQSEYYPLRYAGYEPWYFEHEADMAAEITAMDATEVVIWDGDVHPGGWGGGMNSYWDVTFPDQAAMAGFDSLAIHLWMACPDHLQHKDNGCPEWDRTEQLYLCDRALPEAEPFPVPDTCDPGSPESPAETWPCQCEKPWGEVVEATRVCNEDGAGFGDCGCACDTEIARWITTYAREGEWLTDLSPLLPLLASGGPQRLRLNAVNSNPLHGAFLLHDAGKTERPAGIRYLWGKAWGEGFNEGYNGLHPDVTFDLPAGTTRTELVAVISGHGSGTTEENCAEFCDHHHEFKVNGTPFTKTHPEVNTWFGCAEQVAAGVVPNQFGTWIFGRAGWCPGLDVAPWVVDVSDHVTPTGNALSYRGLFQGGDYVPIFTGGGDYNPEIRMSSWMVFYTAKGEGDR